MRRSLRFALQLFGLRGVHQLYAIGEKGPRSTLIVGPATLPIPPEGWGAVETIIDEMSNTLATTRPTMVLNSNSLWLWTRAFRKRHDAIHVHLDSMLRRVAFWRSLAKSSTPIVLWSHYPYLDQQHLWNEQFHLVWSRVQRHLRETDVFVALNPSIAKVAKSQLAARVVTLPNASAFRPRLCTTPSRELLVLGKVDTRKRQFEISELALRGIDLTFVGPINDRRVLELISAEPQSARSAAFAGEWNRSRLADEMSSFKVLLLPSRAEADALVLYEAQLAGLSIVCSQHALGAQDPGLPWIYTHETDTSVEQLQTLCALAVAENTNHRPEIVKYAQANFLWSNRIERLNEFLQQSQIS